MVLMSLCVNSGYNVGVAHCNFGLRGQESDEDEILVQERARKYGIECYNRRFDTVGEMERTGESMEMAARRLRYAWFAELCEKHGYTVIAVTTKEGKGLYRLCERYSIHRAQRLFRKASNR